MIRIPVKHRQGFAHLEDIESCILEPGGTFFVRGKAPSAEEGFRAEALTRLEQLSKRLDESGIDRLSAQLL